MKISKVEFWNSPMLWTIVNHCVENYIENFKACWKPCQKFQSMLKHMSMCVLEPPVLPADLFVPSPGYEVPPDLATVPRPLVYTFCGSRCPKRRFKCSEWRCRYCDVKHVISCRSDVMNPYKRSRPDRNAVLWLPTANWTVSHVCPTVCSPGTVLEVLTVILVK